MTRFLPQSLFGQTLLILLAGLVVSHLVGAWVYTSDRERAVRTIGGLALAQRVANLTRLVEQAPADWRGRIVAAASDPTFRVSLSPGPPSLAEGSGPAAAAIAEFLASQLPADPARRIRVAVAESSGPPFRLLRDHPMPIGPMGPRGAMGPIGPMGPMMHAAGAWRGLEAAVELADGAWLSFATAVPDTGPAVSWRFVLSMAVMALITLAVSAWAVRRVAAPLGEIARAAQRLGKDVAAPPLAAAGTVEMRRAAEAFNAMQAQLRRLIENRTRMLGAISHDLRTPLTLLRLRAEGVGNGEEREKMLATIADMDAMIEATLAFVRDDATAEPRRPTDLTALLASIVDDMADAGLPVSLEAAPSVVYACEPAALKRAIRNLVDNAVKYGKAARVAIRTAPGTIAITVDDDGPGLPDAELVRVFQPFYRLEGSRSRETGGIGLGLAIALSVVQAHGGDLTLANRADGGLRATIVLPV